VKSEFRKREYLLNKELLHYLAGALFSYATLGSFFAGIRMLVSKTFLPFHRQAAGVPWSDIPEGIRLLILALMRVGGTGGILAGVLCFLILYPSFFGVNWSLTLILGGWSATYWFAIFLITYYVHRRTNADTPFRSSFSLFAAILTGTVIRVIV
jgi:hypothetical protein